MSASLVGSEMCIRDRSKTSWSKGIGEQGTVMTLLTAGLRKARRIGLWTCLLYTSDAADDM
eukprot:6833288-Alexandrium_andersonii.AAC.1